MKCESMVYLNKIFSNSEAHSCPLLGELTATSETFDQQLSFYEPADCSCGCGCNCNSCNCLEFGDDLNFVIDNTQVFVSDFLLEDPTSLATENVTVNGIPVDTLEYEGGRFIASTNALLSRISNCACLERGLSTKAMFLISDAGPWLAKLTIVVQGSVFGCGSCKKFKLIMTTSEGISINIPGTSTFAISDICLPCTTGGIAPIINFSFLANASLLNPVITTDTGTGTCNVILTGALVTEPAATIQVTRQTLFQIDAEPVSAPCDDLRRCSQSPGVCTCQQDPISPCNPCCNTCSNGVSAISAATEGDCGCDEPCHTEICCQFNGMNGCSL